MRKDTGFGLLAFIFYFIWAVHQTSTDPMVVGAGLVEDVWAGALFCSGLVGGAGFLVCVALRTRCPFVVRALVAGIDVAGLIFLIRLGTVTDASAGALQQMAFTVALPALCCTLGAEVVVIALAFIFNPPRSFARALI